MSESDLSVSGSFNKYKYPNQITEEDLNNDYSNLISEYNIIKNKTDTVVSEYEKENDKLVENVRKYKKTSNTPNEDNDNIKKMIAKHGALEHCFDYYKKVNQSMDNIIDNTKINNSLLNIKKYIIDYFYTTFYINNNETIYITSNNVKNLEINDLLVQLAKYYSIVTKIRHNRRAYLTKKEKKVEISKSTIKNNYFGGKRKKTTRKRKTSTKKKKVSKKKTVTRKRKTTTKKKKVSKKKKVTRKRKTTTKKKKISKKKTVTRRKRKTSTKRKTTTRRKK